jgi:hypothetical protein
MEVQFGIAWPEVFSFWWVIWKRGFAAVFVKCESSSSLIWYLLSLGLFQRETTGKQISAL